MNKQIIATLSLVAIILAVVVAANEYENSYESHYPQQHYEPSYPQYYAPSYPRYYAPSYPRYEERRYLQIPALKPKISLDKLMFRLPKLNLGSLIRTEREYKSDYEHEDY